MKKIGNIIYFLRAREISSLQTRFRSRIVILPRPNINEDYYDYLYTFILIKIAKIRRKKAAIFIDRNVEINRLNKKVFK